MVALGNKTQINFAQESLILVATTNSPTIMRIKNKPCLSSFKKM